MLVTITRKILDVLISLFSPDLLPFWKCNFLTVKFLPAIASTSLIHLFLILKYIVLLVTRIFKCHSGLFSFDRVMSTLFCIRIALPTV